MPDLLWLQDICHHWQDLSQYGMNMEELLAPLVGGPELCPVTGMWYLVSSLLAVWASHPELA